MSSIYKNGPYWYYQNAIIVNGRKKTIHKSLGTKSEQQAKKLKKMYDLKFDEKLRNPFEETRVFLSQQIEEYLDVRKKEIKRNSRSHRTYDSDDLALSLFKKYIQNEYGDIYIDEIRQKHVKDFHTNRIDVDHVTDTTIAVNLRHLRSFFSYLQKHKNIIEHPMQGYTIPTTERKEIIPQDGEWKTLYENLQKEMKSKEYDWFKTIIWILLNTGMRIGEVVILKWKRGKDDYGKKTSKNYVYLSDDLSQITIYYKKRLRTIPIDHISEVFNRIPKKYVLYRGKPREKLIKFEYVFENPVTRGTHSLSNLSRYFKKFMIKLKLNDQFTPHSIRHGYASFLVKKGENIFNISKILGHSVSEITEFVYTHHTPDDLKNTMAKITEI